MPHPIPSPWSLIPFLLLLLLIAIGPVFFPDWWRRNYGRAALILSAIPVAYYLVGLEEAARLTEMGREYFSFIALIGSLFIVSSGIHIRVRGEATPERNVLFLFAGALLSNLLGTTGASMLLIRPWLRMNHYRVTGHHVIFFIFLISNVGGCLTPIGDPPLFAGYLRGVPFWWVAKNCWPIWLLGVGLLLAAFYVVDRRNYQKAPVAVREQLTAQEVWRFEGLHNVIFLGAILFAASVRLPPFVREAILLGAGLGSYFSTGKSIHQANDFNFDPFREVAVLFAGLFATMLPALDLLHARAGELGSPGPTMIYWAAGSLSSVLDNLPTYYSMLNAILGAGVDPQIVSRAQEWVQSSNPDLLQLGGEVGNQLRNTVAALQRYHADRLASGTVGRDEIEICYLLGNPALNKSLIALSIGSVFFGANTYIGNGPNFMVKAIADHRRVKTPHFGQYILGYTLPFMLPMLIIVWCIFFRG